MIFSTAKKHTLKICIIIEEKKNKKKKKQLDFEGQHFLNFGGKAVHSFVFESILLLWITLL